MNKLLQRAVDHYHYHNSPANMVSTEVPEWAPRAGDSKGKPPKIKFRTKLSVSDLEYLGEKHNLTAEYIEASVSSVPFIVDVFMLTACGMDGSLMVTPEDRDRFAGEVDSMLCATIITRCGAYKRIMESASGHEGDSLGKPSAS